MRWVRQLELEDLAGYRGFRTTGLEPVNALLEAVGHGGLGGLGPEAIDDVLHAVDLFGLHGDLLGQPHLICLTTGQVLRVGALVFVHGAGGVVAATVQVDNAGDGLVQQVEVVADHDQGTAIRGQEVQHPDLGVGVEVVGRFVEQQNVGTGEQDPDHLYPAALATRERP